VAGFTVVVFGCVTVLGATEFPIESKEYTDSVSDRVNLFSRPPTLNFIRPGLLGTGTWDVGARTVGTVGAGTRTVGTSGAGARTVG